MEERDMANVSPGVFSKIIDLSQFVQAVPSTIGFMAGITEKGEDNVLKFVGSRADFISEFGEPNISTYGKHYGQGPYCAYNYLGESGALYWMRCLPDNAAYANFRIDSTVTTSTGSDATAECGWEVKTNTTYWSAYNPDTQWDAINEWWEPSGVGELAGDVSITETGVWASGYRPSYVRLVIAGVAGTATVLDSNGSTIGSDTYTGAVLAEHVLTIPLTFTTYDVDRITIADTFDSGAVIIAEVEFYVCSDSTSSSTVTDTTSTMSVTYVESVNSEAEFATNLVVSDNTYPVCFLRPIGRGQWYNRLGIRISEVSNPTLWDTYILDVYERQSDGDDVIIESFEVSFDPFAKDSAGESLWIVDVLELYSSVLRAEMWVDEDTDTYSAGYYESVKVYDKEIGTTTVSLTSGTITDVKQDFSDWQSDTGPADYLVVAKDGRGVTIWGWLGESEGVDNETITVYTESGILNSGWNGDTSNFDINTSVEYRIKKTKVSFADPFVSSEPVPLRKGSDGDLLEDDGSLDTTEATTLLNQAYSGIIDDDVLDTENVYFSMVFDCGYPSDVKTAISTLCQTRRDCVGILDNGDNSSSNNAISTRTNTHTFNNYFVALYESYNKVFDSFTGQDMWISPIYHMSYILPRNDTVAELWFAAAGFNRAAIDTIKELRYNPRLGQRDQLYLKQLNPIVKFNPGYVVWGQLTSQAKASALQDLNIVRLVLYIKRAFEEYCRYFIFEQNDSITWSLVAGQLVEFLEVIRKKRGLYDYSVEVGATDYERKTKKFHVNVTLNPTRVVEQIELNFFIV
jgi:hypothetical protein